MHDSIVDEIQPKCKALNESLWEGKAPWGHVEHWFSQFKAAPKPEDDEQVQMLFLASNFMYFGTREIRTLLRSLYRDVYQHDIFETIRRNNSDTKDRKIIEREFMDALSKTRFIGVGNPSESGSHLLYYFRQENRLGKKYFFHSHEIFSRVGAWKIFLTRIKDPSIDRYVFIDDLCGSGSQAKEYSESIVRPLKRLRKSVRVSYYTLFGTVSGLDAVRSLKWFDDVKAVVELDDTFKCFSPTSRIYRNEQPPFDQAKANEICKRYGSKLEPGFPLGWRDGQLLMGFCHNTPDNTLPIIWYDEPEGQPWVPLFRRFPKQYGWEA